MTSKACWVLSLLLLPAVARAQAKEPNGSRWDFFTARREVFHPLLADPREIQIKAAYYRLNSNNVGDIALGHSWGMARWTTGDENPWKLQWNIEGMAYSRFRISGGVNEFDTIDFFGNLPFEFRRHHWSGRVMLFHQSSHLGDDYIRRTGDQGFRYSIDGLRGHASWDALKGLRLYAGQTYLLHTVPGPARWMSQAGLEISSPAVFPFGGDFPSFIYLGQDCQWKEQSDWKLNSQTLVGLRMRFRNNPRAVRIQLGHYEGRSPYGQFFNRKESYNDLSIAFEL